MSAINYKECSCNELVHLFNGELILIITATDLETKEFHNELKPLHPYTNILRVYEGSLTYYFGVLGNYNIVHVQSSMGSISRDSSIMTITTALRLLKSKIVIMVGIAFGIDEQSQNIGDVLIAESIIPYNPRRVGRKTTIGRGIEAPSSKILLNRFRSIKTTWEYLLEGNIKAKLIGTRLLSGEELVDNVKHRNKLIRENPDSKGGEMEGAGLYAACDSLADWIIVKGICDFADGNKGENKHAKQLIAMKSAISACVNIFNTNTAFKEFGILPIMENRDIKETRVNDVLFDIYDLKKENFYIERTNDDQFNKLIKQYGIWVYGPSGCGKSNLIIRNLLKSNINFIQVNLATCIGLTIELFFKEILYEIASKVEGVSSQIQPSSFFESVKLLMEILEKYYLNEELIIFIEEIPIDTEINYQEFTEKLFSVFITKNQRKGLENIRFVLSSINNPTAYLKPTQMKIHEKISFFQLRFWESNDIRKLIKVVNENLNIDSIGDLEEDLVSLSMGSPRFIKKYFRSVISYNKFEITNLRFILEETRRELNS